MPKPAGAGCRITPVLSPEWSPCPPYHRARDRALLRRRRSPRSAPAAAPRRQPRSRRASARRRTRASSTRSIEASRPLTENGFSMKSAAPSLVAATAFWILPWPEIMMTRTCGLLGLDAAQQLDAVDVRHPDVEQHQRGFSRAICPSPPARRRCRAPESPRRSGFRAAKTGSAPHHPPPVRSHSLLVPLR